MEPQITDKERWAEVETNCGTEFVPIEQLGITFPMFWPTGHWDQWVAHCAALVRDYLQGSNVFSIQERMGYGARLSAPGCLDCTDWAVFDTEEDARAYLEETYGDA